MSDTPPPPPSKEAEAERIRIWRAERAAVAEAEKQDRVRQRQAARAAEHAAAATQSRAAAQALLPDATAIAAARQDIADRVRAGRRRFWVQMMLVVILPTLLVAFYATRIATPLYEARSVMVVSKAGRDNDNGLGGILGAVGGAGPSNLHEAFMAHEFIKSQALMDQLETDLGLVSRYSGPQMDPVRRLRDVPLLGLNKTDQFTRFVTSSINIQTGLMTLYVRAFTPQEAQAISQTILMRVAEQINGLSADLFDERLAQSENAVAQARAELLAAQAALTRLQIDSGEADPRARIDGIYRQIGQLETEAEELRSRIAVANVSGQGDTYQTQRLTELEDNLVTRIADLRRRIVQDVAGDGQRALNTVLLDYELAQLQVRIAEESLSTALSALVQTRDKAVLSRSQFQIVVPPNTTDNPGTPNIPATILVSFFTLLSALSIYRLLRTSQMG